MQLVKRSERGQTLPLALGGVVALLVFGFFAVNYANTLRWQVRAQNAADSAAQAVLALQTQQFNQMTAALYAADVEEYRIRHLLNGMVLAAHSQGGCLYGSPTTLNLPLGCDTIEQELQSEYTSAVGRYTADILALHQITAKMSFTNTSIDALELVRQIGNCTGAVGGDCAFSYGPTFIGKRDGMQSVVMDANGTLKPSPGNQTGPASNLTSELFAPMMVEVYACATVPSLIPSFMSWKFPPFIAVARGAATPVMVEEDWLQPGAIENPFTPGQKYQPKENYLGGADTRDSSGYDWYNLDFGGNGFVAVGQHFGFQINVDEFSVYLGWWNSIPIHAFTGQKSLAAMGCK